MNWIIRQIAKITLIGKLVEKLGPKVPIIFIVISLIFAIYKQLFRLVYNN